MKIRSIVILLLFSVVSCQNNVLRQVTSAFYHWKSVYNPTLSESQYLSRLHCHHLYLRLFDIDWNEEARFPEPISILNQTLATSDIVTPVIFITNQTFLHISITQTDSLAALVLLKINAVLEGRDISVRELQFDCDWTPKSKDKYFSFLRDIKTRLSKASNAVMAPTEQVASKNFPNAIPHERLSSKGFPNTVSHERLTSKSGQGRFLNSDVAPPLICVTVRLHQIKFYEDTGVPPVDKGILMCYNTENLDDPKTENSILHVETLRGYLAHLKDYTLPLDVALPLFSWGVLSRNGEVTKLINNLQKEELDSFPEVFAPINANHYRLKKNSYLKGYYLYRDDEIRTENVGLETLRRTADMLSERLPRRQEPLIVSFYHLDSAIVNRYRYEDLEDILSRFR